MHNRNRAFAEKHRFLHHKCKGLYFTTRQQQTISADEYIETLITDELQVQTEGVNQLHDIKNKTSMEESADANELIGDWGFLIELIQRVQSYLSPGISNDKNAFQ